MSMRKILNIALKKWNTPSLHLKYQTGILCFNVSSGTTYNASHKLNIATVTLLHKVKTENMCKYKSIGCQEC